MMTLLLQMLLSFMKIGALSFGGAYASMPLVEQEIVVSRGWLTLAEFSDLVAMDELTPGPILINSATFVGMRVAGVPGAVVATIGCILPSCMVSLALVLLYRQYRKARLAEGVLHALKCMSCALIFSTLITIAGRTILSKDMPSEVASIVVAGFAFYLLRYRKLAPLTVMLICGALGVLVAAVL
jgi:chromate transporter